MTTAPPTLVALQAKLVKNLHTVNLGIVGDAAHIRTGGYHIGAKSLRAAGMRGDYSLEFALDYKATHDYACAIDIGGTTGQLQTLGERIYLALRNKDPRVFNKVRGVNAAFGGQTIDRRFDTEDPANPNDSNLQPSSDRNHLHLEVYRTLVLEQSVMDGIYDVLAGVPIKPTPPPVPGRFPAWPFPVKNLTEKLGNAANPSRHVHGGVASDSAAVKAAVWAVKQKLHALGFGGLTMANPTWDVSVDAALLAYRKKYTRRPLGAKTIGPVGYRDIANRKA